MRQQAALTLPVSLVREFSPDALAMMEFVAQSEIDVCRKMYSPIQNLARGSRAYRTAGTCAKWIWGMTRDLFTEVQTGFQYSRVAWWTSTTTAQKGTLAGEVVQRYGRTCLSAIRERRSCRSGASRRTEYHEKLDCPNQPIPHRLLRGGKPHERTQLDRGTDSAKHHLR